MSKKLKQSTDDIPTKLLDLFKEHDIVIRTAKSTGAKYIEIPDSLKDKIPFDVLSDSFKTAATRKNTETDRIYITEMLNTMTKKTKITSTTKANTYAVIPFFEAVGRLKINEDTHEVYNDRGLFRAEDKFVFRLASHLKNIFPGIEDKIRTQVPIGTIRRTFIVDICIELSETSVIGIEFDEQHHFTRDNNISDTVKRNLISRLIELRIFRNGIDKFDHFLIALCYDIIKYYDNSSDTKDTKLEWIASFIAYNINMTEKEGLEDGEPFTTSDILPYISIMEESHVSIKQLSGILLNHTTVDKVNTAIKKYLKLRLMNKNKVVFDDDGEDIVEIHTSELLNFLMLFDDPSSKSRRGFFAKAITEYLLVLSGSYDTYRYICSAKQFVHEMEDEVLAYSMTPYTPSATNKHIKKETVDLDTILMAVTSAIKPFVDINVHINNADKDVHTIHKPNNKMNNKQKSTKIVHNSKKSKMKSISSSSSSAESTNEEEEELE